VSITVTPAFTLAVSDAASSIAPLRAQVTFDAGALGGGPLQTDTGSSGADVGASRSLQSGGVHNRVNPVRHRLRRGASPRREAVAIERCRLSR
jgi:hypothetical protein